MEATDTRTQHTPGPWRDTGIPKKYDAIQIAGDGPAAVCLVHRANRNAEANARLIASAPALLAALEAIAALPDGGSGYVWSKGDHGQRLYAIDIARAAIASKETPK